MTGEQLRSVVVTLASLGVLVGWPLLAQTYDLPIVIWTVLWVGIGVVIVWFVIRPLFLPPGVGGMGW